MSSKEAVEDDRDEIMCKSEKLDGIEEKVKELEIKLEAKNLEVEKRTHFSFFHSRQGSP